MPESEASSTESAEDVVTAAVFATTDMPPIPPRERAKRYRTRDEDESQLERRNPMS